MTTHGKQTKHGFVQPRGATSRARADRTAELEALADALHRELVAQWWPNHVEHCDVEWPHPSGTLCHWPPPEILKNAEDLLGLAHDGIQLGGAVPKRDDTG